MVRKRPGQNEGKGAEKESPPTSNEEVKPILWAANPLQLEAKFPRELNNPQAIAQFTAICMAVNLNPFLGEIIPIHGRPYITEEGWLRMIDERAPGELVVDKTELATEKEKKGFGIEVPGWLGKATIVRRVNAPGGPADREVIDWSFFSQWDMENSVISAVKAEPWRQAMKGAHVRALRRAFRDVLAKTVGQLGIGDELDPNLHAEAMAELGAGEPDTGDDKSNRSRFWARATKMGIKNGSPELSQLLGISEVGVGMMKEYWLNKGHTWAEANLLLDQREQPEAIPERCANCNTNITTTMDMQYTEDGALVCSEECGNRLEAAANAQSKRKTSPKE